MAAPKVRQSIVVDWEKLRAEQHSSRWAYLDGSINELFSA
jgi:hypothetical protein